MFKTYNDEEWKEIKLEEGALRLRYAISSYGRIASFHNDLTEDGHILKGGLIGGYPSLPIRPFGKTKTLYIHKLVGEYFVPRESEDKDRIIHLDHNKQNNCTSNLKWVTRSELSRHQQQNPAVIRGREKKKATKLQEGQKLNSTQVMLIKKRLNDPNRKTRLKMLAKQFGVSEMQLYRIRTGENWGHVQIKEDQERLNPKKKPD